MIPLLTLIFSFLGLTLANWSQCHYYKSAHIKVDIGLYAFNFGEVGVSIRTKFEFFTKVSTILTVFDCYCSGDNFAMFDGGDFIGGTLLPLSDKCEFYSDDPFVCYNQINGSWGIAHIRLNPGHHNVTITPYDSPFGKGTGFLRVNTACGVVPCCVGQTGKDDCNYEVIKEY